MSGNEIKRLFISSAEFSVSVKCRLGGFSKHEQTSTAAVRWSDNKGGLTGSDWSFHADQKSCHRANTFHEE